MHEMASKKLIGMKEEITDILTPQGIESGQFKKGQVLKFNYEDTITSIKITKLDKKNRRAWGQHIDLISYDVGITHYGHNVDSSEQALEVYGSPYCTDCDLVITEPATAQGRKRMERRLEGTLEDGTVLEDEL